MNELVCTRREGGVGGAGLLAEHGQHRGVRSADLLIAATAETYDATLVHYDRDFSTVADLTGQPADWVVPAGSID